MTVVLQMLVFVASALGFAAYVLKRDRRDKQRVDRENVQPSFYFPELHRDEDDAARSGAAVARLS